MAWTSIVQHFGNRATSRGEGAHSNMKRYLQVSNGGLDQVRDIICLAIDNQFHELQARLCSEKIRHPHQVKIPFFKDLITHVFIFALNELFKQYELAKSGQLSARCKSHFYKTMGIPCGHMIIEMKFEALQLHAIHTQWRIDTRSFVSGARMDDGEEINALLTQFKSKYEGMPLAEKDNTKGQLNQFLCASLPLSLEPIVQPHKGRPLGSKNKKENNSTKRDPSAFEIMEKKSRTCSYCKSENHDIRTCSNKKKASLLQSDGA